MRVYCQKSLFLIFSLLVFVAKAQDSTSNDLPYPIEDRTGDFLTDPSNNPFDFDDPDAIEQHVDVVRGWGCTYRNRARPVLSRLEG